jgi:hypothetical protein
VLKRRRRSKASENDKAAAGQRLLPRSRVPLAAFERYLAIAVQNLKRMAREDGRDPDDELKAALEGLS